MYENDVSVTTKNLLIDNIAQLLQECRIELQHENPDIILSERDTGNILLVCVMHFMLHYKGCIVNTNFMPLCFEDIIIDLNSSTWISNFLSINIAHNKIITKTSYKKLTSITYIQEWEELCYYAFEAFEYKADEYLSSPIKKGIRLANVHKKRQGIYYTPEDVIHYMVGHCVDTLDKIVPMENQTYMDCSCGSGMFLLIILRYRIEHKKCVTNIGSTLEIIKKTIWGIDISPQAIANCMMTFMIYILVTFKEALSEIDKIGEIISESFVCGDATNMQNVLCKNKQLPTKFHCFIGNPPYVAVNGNDNLFISFVENILDFSNEICCSSLVLPLSVCYSQNKPYSTLRERVTNDKAYKWTFVNFDRSPDSLFGDQVKTRNTIIFRENTNQKCEFFSSRLIRWTSECRQILFNDIKLCNITDIVNKDGIPKLGDSLEKIAYEKINSGYENICAMSSKRGGIKSNFVAINGTAYNWICAYDHLPPSIGQDGSRYIPSSMSVIHVESMEDVFFAIATLSNRIAYWYWSVIGDGFHLNSSFFKKFRISERDFDINSYKDIVELGCSYCKQIVNYPTISYNYKKKIVNYNHLPLLPVISEIEQLIIKAKEIPYEFSQYIADWYDRQVTCGRNDVLKIERHKDEK
jgi:hypothetical protein